MSGLDGCGHDFMPEESPSIAGQDNG